jgi:hypothetical protein
VSVYRKLLVVAALATVTLAIAVNGASATVTSLSISRGGSISEASEGLVTFRESEGVEISCRLSLRGSLVTRAVRVEQTLGQITSVTLEGCRGGTIEAVLNLPWSMAVQYLLYLNASNVCNVVRTPSDPANTTQPCGSLVGIFGASIAASILGGLVRCLYGGSTELLGLLHEINLSTRMLGTAYFLLFGLNLSSGPCGSTATVSGTLAGPSPGQTITFI